MSELIKYIKEEDTDKALETIKNLSAEELSKISDISGTSLLHLATQCGHYEIIHALIQKLPETCPSEEINNILKLIEAGTRTIKGSDNDVVVVVGKTGSGKSTLVNFLSHPESMEITEKLNGDIIINLHSSAPPNLPTIGHTLESETTIPNSCYDTTRNILFWDCPGFEDTKGPKQEIPNAFYLMKLFEVSTKFKLMLLVSGNDLFSNKVVNVLPLVNLLGNLFDDVTVIEKGLCLVITQAESKRNVNHAVNQINEIVNSNTSDLNPKGKILLASFTKNKDRIAFFRKPDEIELLSESAHKLGRDDILKVLEATSFVDKLKINIAITEKSKLYIYDLTNYTNSLIIKNINELCQKITLSNKNVLDQITANFEMIEPTSCASFRISDLFLNFPFKMGTQIGEFKEQIKHTLDGSPFKLHADKIIEQINYVEFFVETVKNSMKLICLEYWYKPFSECNHSFEELVNEAVVKETGMINQDVVILCNQIINNYKQSTEIEENIEKLAEHVKFNKEFGDTLTSFVELSKSADKMEFIKQIQVRIIDSIIPTDKVLTSRIKHRMDNLDLLLKLNPESKCKLDVNIPSFTQCQSEIERHSGIVISKIDQKITNSKQTELLMTNIKSLIGNVDDNVTLKSHKEYLESLEQVFKRDGELHTKIEEIEMMMMQMNQLKKLDVECLNTVKLHVKILLNLQNTNINQNYEKTFKTLFKITLQDLRKDYDSKFIIFKDKAYKEVKDLIDIVFHQIICHCKNEINLEEIKAVSYLVVNLQSLKTEWNTRNSSLKNERNTHNSFDSTECISEVVDLKSLVINLKEIFSVASCKNSDITDNLENLKNKIIIYEKTEILLVAETAEIENWKLQIHKIQIAYNSKIQDSWVKEMEGFLEHLVTDFKNYVDSLELENSTVFTDAEEFIKSFNNSSSLHTHFIEEMRKFFKLENNHDDTKKLASMEDLERVNEWTKLKEVNTVENGLKILREKLNDVKKNLEKHLKLTKKKIIMSAEEKIKSDFKHYLYVQKDNQSTETIKTILGKLEKLKNPNGRTLEQTLNEIPELAQSVSIIALLSNLGTEIKSYMDIDGLSNVIDEVQKDTDQARSELGKKIKKKYLDNLQKHFSSLDSNLKSFIKDNLLNAKNFTTSCTKIFVPCKTIDEVMDVFTKLMQVDYSSEKIKSDIDAIKKELKELNVLKDLGIDLDPQESEYGLNINSNIKNFGKFPLEFYKEELSKTVTNHLDAYINTIRTSIPNNININQQITELKKEKNKKENIQKLVSTCELKEKNLHLLLVIVKELDSLNIPGLCVSLDLKKKLEVFITIANIDEDMKLIERYMRKLMKINQNMTLNYCNFEKILKKVIVGEIKEFMDKVLEGLTVNRNSFTKLLEIEQKQGDKFLIYLEDLNTVMTSENLQGVGRLKKIIDLYKKCMSLDLNEKPRDKFLKDIRKLKQGKYNLAKFEVKEKIKNLVMELEEYKQTILKSGDTEAIAKHWKIISEFLIIIMENFLNEQEYSKHDFLKILNETIKSKNIPLKRFPITLDKPGDAKVKLSTIGKLNIFKHHIDKDLRDCWYQVVKKVCDALLDNKLLKYYESIKKKTIPVNFTLLLKDSSVNLNIEHDHNRQNQLVSLIRAYYELKHVNENKLYDFHQAILHRGYMTTSELNEYLSLNRRISSVVVKCLSITFDEDIKKPGVNLTIVAPRWFVNKPLITINLTGLAGDNPGNAINGKDGKPGNPGGNGGHFYGIYDSCLPSSLSFMVDGGIGGNGGNGGNGVNGIDGVDGASLGNYLCSNNIESIRCDEIENIRTNFEFYFCTSRNVKVFRNYGKPGTKGGDAGAGGVGGKGGSKGMVCLESLKDGKVKQFSGKDGVDGVSGCHGMIGKGGRHGTDCEIAYDTYDQSWIKDVSKGWNGIKIIQKGVANYGSKPSHVNNLGFRNPEKQMPFDEYKKRDKTTAMLSLYKPTDTDFGQNVLNFYYHTFINKIVYIKGTYTLRRNNT